MSNIIRTASFSRCRRYRYALGREWHTNEAKKTVVFIGLNPSTADHRVDDPTIRRCMDFARRWGYNSLTVANLFAYRTPYPSELRKATDPVGPTNQRKLTNVIQSADLVVACWGRDGSWMNQDQRLVRRYRAHLFCLARNKDGSPAHPLYQRAETTPIPWLTP